MSIDNVPHIEEPPLQSNLSSSLGVGESHVTTERPPIIGISTVMMEGTIQRAKLR